MTADRDSIPPIVSDLEAALTSWQWSLKARRRSQRTIDGYLEATRQLVAYLVAHHPDDLPDRIADLTRTHLEKYIAHLVENRSPATARNRYMAIKQLWKWMAEEGDVDRDPFDRMEPPAAPSKPIPIVSDGDLKKLLKACSGTSHDDRRDRAIILVFIDSGIRLSEMADLTLDRIDFEHGVAIVTGKGDKTRSVPMSPKVMEALTRYLRDRARHRHASEPGLWLGRWGPLKGSGIRQMLRRRCALAGIDPIHPHQFRHGFADRFLSDGGQEGDLMMLAGWSKNSRAMLDRYGAAGAERRAMEAHKKHSPVDRLL